MLFVTCYLLNGVAIYLSTTKKRLNESTEIYQVKKKGFTISQRHQFIWVSQ